MLGVKSVNSLNRLSENWPLVEHRSRLPHAALWRELVRYSGRDLAEDLFQRAPADRDFIIPFRNAINAADDMIAGWEDVADEFTRGSSSLLWGLVVRECVALCSLNSAVLNKRARQHGLGIASLPEGRRRFLNTRVNFGSAEESLGIINLAFGGSSVSGQSVTVQDLLRLLPEMTRPLEHVHINTKAIEVFPHSWSGDLEMFSSSNPSVVVQLVTEATITIPWLRDNIAIFPYLKSKDTAPLAGYDNIITWQRWADNEAPSGRTDVAELQALCIESAGKTYLLPKLKKRAISEYVAYLAVLYVIGHLARYYPDYWIEMQPDRIDDYFLKQEF